jgi:hypothetical protein
MDILLDNPSFFHHHLLVLLGYSLPKGRHPHFIPFLFVELDHRVLLLLKDVEKQGEFHQRDFHILDLTIWDSKHKSHRDEVKDVLHLVRTVHLKVVEEVIFPRQLSMHLHMIHQLLHPTVDCHIFKVALDRCRRPLESKAHRVDGGLRPPPSSGGPKNRSNKVGIVAFYDYKFELFRVCLLGDRLLGTGILGLVHHGNVLFKPLNRLAWPVF